MNSRCPSTRNEAGLGGEANRRSSLYSILPIQNRSTEPIISPKNPTLSPPSFPLPLPLPFLQADQICNPASEASASPSNSVRPESTLSLSAPSLLRNPSIFPTRPFQCAVSGCCCCCGVSLASIISSRVVVRWRPSLDWSLGKRLRREAESWRRLWDRDWICVRMLWDSSLGAVIKCL